MTGCVDNIDLVVLVIYRRVFGENGDSPFFFQFIAVHDAGPGKLAIPEHAALFKKAIDQRGFSMIDMSNDSNISD